MIFDEEFCIFNEASLTLDIDLRGRLGFRYHLTGWNDGLRVYCDLGDGWEYTDDLDAWECNWLAYSASHPITRYFRCFPKTSWRLCEQFDYYKLGMLRFVRNVPEATGLIKSIPALAWLLPERKQCLEISWEGMQSVCQSKRKIILKQLFGHGSKSLVRLMLSCRCGGTRFDYNLIRAIVCDPSIHRFLCHAPSLDLHKVGYLTKARGIINHAWFRNAFFDDNFSLSYQYISNCSSLAKDIIDMGRALGIDDAPLAVARCPNFDQLYKLHERWVTKINSREFLSGGGVEFAPPPLPGNNDILPVTNELALSIEGRLMAHCIASYKERIMSGACYIYRVLAPQRGTLEVLLGGAGKQSVLGQFKLYGNQEPSQESWKAVHDWFKEKSV